MVNHLVRLVLATFLAFASSLLGGCVLAKLTAGFTIAPPGGYVTLEGAAGDPPATTQPIKVIGIELPPTTAPSLDIPAPTGDVKHATG